MYKKLLLPNISSAGPSFVCSLLTQRLCWWWHGACFLWLWCRCHRRQEWSTPDSLAAPGRLWSDVWPCPSPAPPSCGLSQTASGALLSTVKMFPLIFMSKPCSLSHTHHLFHNFLHVTINITDKHSRPRPSWTSFRQGSFKITLGYWRTDLFPIILILILLHALHFRDSLAGQLLQVFVSQFPADLAAFSGGHHRVHAVFSSCSTPGLLLGNLIGQQTVADHHVALWDIESLLSHAGRDEQVVFILPEQGNGVFLLVLQKEHRQQSHIANAHL